jgi:hypothetical protein
MPCDFCFFPFNQITLLQRGTHVTFSPSTISCAFPSNQLPLHSSSPDRTPEIPSPQLHSTPHPRASTPTMGNICSRASNDPEAFSSPGRVVGTNPSNQSAAPRASVPAKANWKNSPGRTLGDSAGAQGDSDEARSNAAIAAQVSQSESAPTSISRNV